MSEGASPVLSLEGVCVSYREGERDLSVLSDCDFRVERGEMVSLVAPSGAGKSTLLHVAGLLERPVSGEVFIEGRATSSMSESSRTRLRRSGIGFVFQFHHLLSEFSALENLMIPQMIAGVERSPARSRALELLDFMRISDRSDHRPGELSGGERQRVAIARAAANGPLLLLADEPTGNLDPETSSHVFGFLEGLVRGSGLSALIATHDRDIARRADRCATLVDGRAEPISL